MEKAKYRIPAHGRKGIYMKKLYEISTELTKLEDALESGGDEQALEELAKNYFATKDQFDAKIKSAGHLMINQESEEVAVKTEIDRLSNRLRAMKNKREWLKAYLKKHMEANDVLKLKFPEFTVSVVKNPSSVEIYDDTKIPSYFIELETIAKIKKNEIKVALKDGAKVEGARLITNKTNLRIK